MTFKERQRYNDQIPASSLPDELLSMIFESAAGALHDYIALKHGLLRSLGAVCSRWRSAAISTPHLWAFIECVMSRRTSDNFLHVPSYEVPVWGELKIHLDRSKDVPLNIQLSLWTISQRCRDLLRSLLDPHLHRCRVLAVREQGRDSSRSFFPLGQPMPLLRTLYWDTQLCTASDMVFGEGFSAPSLYSVKGCQFSEGVFQVFPSVSFPSHSAYQNLVDLDFSLVTNSMLNELALPFNFADPNLITLAATLPNLRRLRVKYPYARIAYYPVRDTILEFASLEALAILSPIPGLEVCKHIVAPNLLHLVVALAKDSFISIQNSRFPNLITFGVHVAEDDAHMEFVRAHPLLHTVSFHHLCRLDPVYTFIVSLAGTVELPSLKLIQLKYEYPNHSRWAEEIFAIAECVLQERAQLRFNWVTWPTYNGWPVVNVFMASVREQFETEDIDYLDDAFRLADLDMLAWS